MSIKTTIATIRALDPRLSASWDSVWSEFRVAIKGDPRSVYRCPDADDAIGTAEAMVKHLDRCQSCNGRGVVYKKCMIEDGFIRQPCICTTKAAAGVQA